MALQVFISHSMTAEDEPLVRSICDGLKSLGMEPYIAERDWQFGGSLAGKIEERLKACDCVVALLTVGGSQSAYVNQELGMARALSKEVVPVVERGVSVTGFNNGIEWVELDREKPDQFMIKLAPFLSRKDVLKTVFTVIAALVFAVLAFLAMRKKA